MTSRILISILYFCFLFGCTNNSKHYTVDDIDNEALGPTPIRILEYAISEVGGLSNITFKENEYINLGFKGVCLFDKNRKESDALINDITLKFLKPKKLNILYKKGYNPPTSLHSLFEILDFGEFKIDSQFLSFEHDKIIEITKIASKKDVLFDNNSSSNKKTIHFAFWAGEIGIELIADSFSIEGLNGKIELEDIPELNDNWTIFCENYWNQKAERKTKVYNSLCESFIPADRSYLIIEDSKKNSK